MKIEKAIINYVDVEEEIIYVEADDEKITIRQGGNRINLMGEELTEIVSIANLLGWEID